MQTRDSSFFPLLGSYSSWRSSWTFLRHCSPRDACESRACAHVLGWYIQYMESHVKSRAKNAVINFARTIGVPSSVTLTRKGQICPTSSGWQVFIIFCFDKASITPKAQTMELLSALLLAQLITNVAESLKCRFPLQKPRCFTDSQVALLWITGIEREWKPFVQNRVDEVRSLVPISCWDHYAGKDNPADISSQSLTTVELSVS